MGKVLLLQAFLQIRQQGWYGESYRVGVTVAFS